MASRTDSEDLKRLARFKLAEGRAEITAESRRLRRQLDPRRAMHRVVDQHTTGLVLASFAAGLIIAFLVFRDRPEKNAGKSLAPRRDSDHLGKNHSRVGIPGMMARAAVPALVKFAIAKPFEQWLARKDRKNDVSS